MLSLAFGAGQSAFGSTEANVKTIENQIRLCEDHKDILKKLDIEKGNSKNRDIYYIETEDRFFQSHFWTIRLRIKSDSLEVDLKHRGDFKTSSQIECEFDKHQESIEKTCKLKNQVPLKELTDVLEGRVPWYKLLSMAQINWLKSESSWRADARVFGVLKSTSLDFKDDQLGDISLDLVHLSSSKNITYHEISIRYSYERDADQTSLFEKFVSDKGLVKCTNQKDWDINKFDVMKILDL